MGKPRPSLKSTYLEALAYYDKLHPSLDADGAPAKWIADHTCQSVGNTLIVLDRLARAGTIRRHVQGALDGQIRTVTYGLPK